MKTILTHSDVLRLAMATAEHVNNYARTLIDRRHIRVCPVPRGGVPATYAVLPHIKCAVEVVTDPNDADCFIDDLIDSGRTMEQYCDAYPGRPFFALIDKPNSDLAGQWLVFPWEVGSTDQSADDIVVRLLQYVGEDPNRGGLLETPHRVLKAWKFWTSGYGHEPGDVLKVFEDGAEKYDQMVIVKNIPFYSHCEHHLAPFFGTATIAYIPNGKIVGLSKLSRLTDIFARRLQVQERITQQIADAIVEHLSPVGVGVFLRARHLCMESRGVCKQGHETESLALRGAMIEVAARAEFLSRC